MASPVECVEIWRGVGGRYSVENRFGYIRRFRVTMDAADAAIEEVLSAAGLPHIGDENAGDCGQVAQGYGWDRSYDTPKVWFVDVEYGALTVEQRRRIDWPDPRDRPLVVEIVPSERQKAIERTPDGTAIVNSAGDPFERGVLVDDARVVIRCKFNIAPLYPALGDSLFIDELLALANNNCVNSDRIAFTPDATKYGEFVFNKEQVIYKYRGLSDVLRDDCIEYQEWSWELHIATRGDTGDDGAFSWRRWLLDIGYNQRDRVGKKHRIELSDHHHPTVPQLLNGNGVWLGPEATRADAKYFPPDGLLVNLAVPFGDGWLPGVTAAP